MKDKIQTLPNSWDYIPLGEIVAKRSRGIVPNKTPDQIFELYSVPSYENGRPDIIPGREIGSNKQIVEERTILLCKINPRINRSWVVGSFSKYQKIASTEWITFPPNEGIESKYLVYFLKQNIIRDFLAANASGVGGSLMRVKPATIQDLLLPIAPNNEQESIVAEIEKQFSRLDEAVAALKRIKANLKRYKASVLKAAVGGKLSEKWRKKNNSESFASQLDRLEVKVSTRRDVPKSVFVPEFLKSYSFPDTWSFISVAELLQRGALLDLKDGNHGTNHPKKSEFTEKGLPFITATQVVDFSIDYDNAPKLSGKPLEKLSVGFSKPDDVILTHKGTVGRVGINTKDCILSPQTTYYRVNQKVIHNKYLAYALASPIFYFQLCKVKSQTTRDFVSISKQYYLFVPLPPLDEQFQIADEIEQKLSIINELELLIEKNVQRAERLRQSIFKKAFSGKLVPQDPNDEPVSILMERIREQQKFKEKEKPDKSIIYLVKEVDIMAKKKIINVLNKASKPMTPEELFKKCGYDVNEVEDFYAELKQVDKEYGIYQDKDNKGKVLIRTIQ